MTPNTNTVYVVTGANRGIGLGLVKALLARAHTTVFATVRNDKSQSSLASALESAPKGDSSTVSIVQLDFSTALSPEHIRTAFDVDRVDVLINNAAFSTKSYPALEMPINDLRSSFEINTIGPLTVAQGLWAYLQKSSAPKIVNVSSSVGCITFQEVVAGAYGPSKAALNWLTRALHMQNEGLVAFALHPGFVSTEMGDSAATEWGFPLSMLESVENSVRGMLEIIDGATREKTSGKFITNKGQELPW
jgi:NAD(P)-dependent dehydrogenase (short-subunit alcohol dehydrogenase family)